MGVYLAWSLPYQTTSLGGRSWKWFGRSFFRVHALMRVGQLRSDLSMCVLCVNLNNVLCLWHFTWYEATPRQCNAGFKSICVSNKAWPVSVDLDDRHGLLPLSIVFSPESDAQNKKDSIEHDLTYLRAQRQKGNFYWNWWFRRFSRFTHTENL